MSNSVKPKRKYVRKQVKEKNKAKPKEERQTKGYVFTLDNYNDKSKRDFNKCTRYEKLKKLKIGPAEELSYIAFQSEICPTTGTPHLQGFLYFNKKKRWNEALEIIAITEIHLEIMEGNFDQNNIYCSKGIDESYDAKAGIRVEIGIRPVGQGSRTDIKKMREEAEKNGVVSAAEKFPETFMSHGPGLQRYLAVIDKRRDRKKPIEVILYIGKSDAGKTRKVFDLHKDDNEVYEPKYANEKVWFDGYDSHKHESLLFNDYSGEIRFETFIKIIDRYGYAGEIKGSTINIKVDKIYITAQDEPKLWYPDISSEKISALCRRFTKIILFNNNKEIDITEKYKRKMCVDAKNDKRYDKLEDEYGTDDKKKIDKISDSRVEENNEFGPNIEDMVKEYKENDNKRICMF